MTYFSCGQCGREWHETGRFICECGNENFMTMTLSQATTQHERDLVAKDICPRCRGDLDTGWECNDCGYDAAQIAAERQSQSDNTEG